MKEILSAAPPAPGAELSERNAPAEHSFNCSTRRGGECDCWYAQPTSECTTCGAIVLGVAEPTVPAASVNWLLTQCEEYQRRAHDAERELLALRAQIEPTAACVEAMRMAASVLDIAAEFIDWPSRSPGLAEECRKKRDALRAQIEQIGGGR